MPNKNDTSICPLCKQSNRCDVSNTSGCWCMNSKVPQALLDKIPEHLRNISCICNNCINQYQQQAVSNTQFKQIT